MPSERIAECLNDRPVLVIVLRFDERTNSLDRTVEFSTIETATQSVLLTDESAKKIIIFDALDLKFKTKFLALNGFDVKDLAEDFQHLINRWKSKYSDELFRLDNDVLFME